MPEKREMAIVIDEECLRGKAAASQRAGRAGGGTMDDILRRLSVVESSVAVIRADVCAINAVLPHLATQSRLSEAEGSLNVKISSLEGSLTARINAVEGSLNARINAVEGSLTAKISDLEASLIRWVVGTGIAVGSLAFAVAKFVN
jgi:hypothetical protein